MIEPLLLTATRIRTFHGGFLLTNASSFFFEHGTRLFLVTSRHVLCDDATGHHPDSVEIELHADPDNLAQSTGYAIPLYRNGKPLWREGTDQGGAVDVATIELERHALPTGFTYRAFTPAHLTQPGEYVEIGSSLLVPGFPMGFHDALHHLPVVRQAIVASTYGLRFQGEGYFLTDARTHRGTSGAPIVMRAADDAAALGDLPWRLLGIHSARLDVGSRDKALDEALGLNCAWYADVLLSLTTG